MTNLSANTEIPAPSAKPTRAKGSLRAQFADLRLRYDGLPQRQQWMVLGIMIVLGWFAVDELVWSYARGWSAESAQIEQALDRGARRGATVNADLKRSVATFGAIEPPGPAATGREELARAIDEVARKHKVAGYSYEARTGQRVKDADTAVLGATIDRLQAEVKFDVNADELPKLIADLEAHPVIDGITAIRLQKNDQNRKITVQATIETWATSSGAKASR